MVGAPHLSAVEAEYANMCPWESIGNCPLCLALHGLPTECSADLETGVWRHADTLWNLEDLDCTPVQTHLGLHAPKLTPDEHIAWQTLLETMREDRLAPGSMTLRQLGEYIQGPCARLPIWNLQAVQETAPGGLPSRPSAIRLGARLVWTAGERTFAHSSAVAE